MDEGEERDPQKLDNSRTAIYHHPLANRVIISEMNRTHSAYFYYYATLTGRGANVRV